MTNVNQAPLPRLSKAPLVRASLVKRRYIKYLALPFFTHRAALISVSIALSQTPAEAAISSRTRGQCVAWSACLAPSLRRYQFILLGEQRQKSHVWTTCPGLHVERSGRDSKLRPLGGKSYALTTTPPCHRHNRVFHNECVDEVKAEASKPPFTMQPHTVARCSLLLQRVTYYCGRPPSWISIFGHNFGVDQHFCTKFGIEIENLQPKGSQCLEIRFSKIQDGCHHVKFQKKLL